MASAKIYPASFVAALAFAAVTCSSIALASSKTTAANAYAAYLRLDGRWYGVTTTRLIEYDAVSKFFIIDDVTATNCLRANGAYPDIGSSASILIGIGAPMSFMGSRLTGDAIVATKPHSTAPTVFEAFTLNGDVRCTGEVTPPDLTPPSETPIFLSSFE